MKKILVVGSPGAGKSTFSRRLSEITGIEVIHLDRIYWRAGWVEPAKEEWRETLEKTLAGNDAWIMDGNYSGTMQMRLKQCDTAIFLDVPRMICVYRILKRVVTYRGRGNRPDMADGCDEKFDWKFLWLVWNYPTRSKPKVERLLAEAESEGKTVIRLKSKQEVEKFFVEWLADKVKSS